MWVDLVLTNQEELNMNIGGSLAAVILHGGSKAVSRTFGWTTRKCLCPFMQWTCSSQVLVDVGLCSRRFFPFDHMDREHRMPGFQKPVLSYDNNLFGL